MPPIRSKSLGAALSALLVTAGLVVAGATGLAAAGPHAALPDRIVRPAPSGVLDPATALAPAKAAPRNDEIEGAANLGGKFPIRTRFTFAGAGVGRYENDTAATGSLWFRFRPAVAGFHRIVVRPASGALPLAVGVGDGLSGTVGGFAKAVATNAKPVVLSVWLSKRRDAYLSVSLGSAAASARAIPVDLRISSTPAGAVVSQNGRDRLFVRNAATDRFNDSFFAPGLVTAYYFGYAPTSPNLSLTTSLSYETGPKGYLTLFGLGTQAGVKGTTFGLAGHIPDMPDSLRTRGAFRAVARAEESVLGITFNDRTVVVMTDTGGAETALAIGRQTSPRKTRPGDPVVISTLVMPSATVTARSCGALSDRDITWRWFDASGRTAVAPAGRAIDLKPKVWRRLVVTIPTPARIPVSRFFGLGVDCTNTSIAPIATHYGTTLMPAAPVSIDFVPTRIDFPHLALKTFDIKLRNSGRDAEVVLLAFSGALLSFSPSGLVQGCVMAGKTCAVRFSDFEPRLTVPAGTTVTVRILSRTESFSGPTPFDPNVNLLSVTAYARAKVLFGQEVFTIADDDAVPFSYDCPSVTSGGVCRQP